MVVRGICVEVNFWALKRGATQIEQVQTRGEKGPNFEHFVIT